MIKALILCHDFPPLNSIGAQRPLYWFKYFKQNGIEPTVITKNWTEKSGDINEIFKGNLQKDTVIEDTESGKIIRVPIHPIFPERLIIKHGINKYVLLRKIFTFLHRTLSHLFFSWDRNKLIYKEAHKLLKQEKFDIVLATGEPWILFKYGHLLKKEFNIKWIPDYRDGWFINQELRIRNDIFFRTLTKFEYYFEKKYISNADLVTTVDPFMAKKLNNTLNKRVEVIYNGFAKFVDKSIINKSSSLPVTITHTGTLKNSQDVEFLLQAIENLHNSKKITPNELTIKFLGLAYEEGQLNRVLSFNKAINNYLNPTNRVPIEEATKNNAISDYGITFADPNWTAIYAKTYDYVATQTPILVIPTDNGLLSTFVKDLNFGKAFNTIKDLEEFILEVIRNKKQNTVSQYNLNIDKASFYLRESQTIILAQKIHMLLNIEFTDTKLAANKSTSANET